ncbi:MAG: NAD(P)(+) transhydrogenase (Re/Si-specific) subunit beta [Pseudomonadales bacterium]|nr:NAD(P)(+) transhydrogenase (Re/Si-specific) subunit beta [Pseudomonadales bacterium]NRA14735.1 NAD(P)(+) transhydrogenase (Re/Si-specific) subunit beta [Oceanospirillaceae bacterium]
MSETVSGIAYLLASILFILALRGLSSPDSARKGCYLGMLGMLIAIITTLLNPQVVSYGSILIALFIGGSIGAIIAQKIQMTALPQLVAGFHSLVGLSAVCVAIAAFYNPSAYGIGSAGNINSVNLLEMALGAMIGAITFSGSLVAFAKLQGIVSGNPVRFSGQHSINALLGLSLVVIIFWLLTNQGSSPFWLLICLSIVLGFTLIIPIGGADMPVVVSMLNSYSGWAAAGIGFTLNNSLLIITGALVGSSGAILSYIMCKAMNRSIINVLLGGFGSSQSNISVSYDEKRSVKSGSAEDAAFIMKNASKVIIVPGYGMAVAQAQHALREMVDMLKDQGVSVSYAIHPVAGRMPGHMNVLLAEANVPYEDVKELEIINPEFATADVAFVIGANDVTNPAAKTDTSSPIYGMPILDVSKANTILFVKRSMSAGYSGVQNELFFSNNTMMLFGDAKKMTEKIVQGI